MLSTVILPLYFLNIPNKEFKITVFPLPLVPKRLEILLFPI